MSDGLGILREKHDSRGKSILLNVRPDGEVYYGT